MQFHLLDNNGYFFSSYDQKSVTISRNNNGDLDSQEFKNNVLLTNNTIKEVVYKNLDQFDLYEQIKSWGIDLVIFGINDYAKLYHHKTLLQLNKMKIGYELMNITATCKSFNYLNAENRNPLALIFFNYEL